MSNNTAYVIVFIAVMAYLLADKWLDSRRKP